VGGGRQFGIRCGYRTRKCILVFFLPDFLPSSLPNLHEVVQRARPSYNPRGTCPCWSKIQQRRVCSRAPHPTVSWHAEVGGLKRGSRTRKCFALTNVDALADVFSFIFIFFSHLNLHEVVQRARPTYNPRGTCPRWSKTQPRRVGQSPSLDSS
jgi:hypothetical protein